MASKMSVSDVGKLIAAVMVGLGIGGGGVAMTKPSPGDTYLLPESSAKTIEKIAERQQEHGEHIARLEASMEHVAQIAKATSEAIKKNTERNEKIIDDIRTLEARIPYDVSWR